MSDIFLHLGMHKTGTTTLQQQFFPRCEGLAYADGDAVRSFTQEVISTDPIYFDAEAARASLAGAIDPARPTLISKESFSGSLYAGVGAPNLDHRSPILHNLAAALPQARAILVIRRQDSLAASMYREYLKMGGTAKARAFFGAPGQPGILPIDRFRFRRYVDEVHRAFPAGVLVLAYEQFAREPEAFLSRIATFMGVGTPEVKLRRSNRTSLGPVGMEVVRIIGRLFQNQLNPGGLIPPVPMYRRGAWRRISPVTVIHDRWPFGGASSRGGVLQQVCQEILHAVRDDNAALDARYGLGLQALGYYAEPKCP